MSQRRRKFDIKVLGRPEFKPSPRPGEESWPLPMTRDAVELLRTFKVLPLKPLLVSEIAAALDKPADSCVDPVISLVKSGSLDLLQRSDGGNHLVALTAAGRAQVETM